MAKYDASKIITKKKLILDEAETQTNSYIVIHKEGSNERTKTNTNFFRFIGFIC